MQDDKKNTVISVVTESISQPGVGLLLLSRPKSELSEPLMLKGSLLRQMTHVMVPIETERTSSLERISLFGTADLESRRGCRRTQVRLERPLVYGYGLLLDSYNT